MTKIPSLIISGLSGGAGKTLVTLGLTGAFRKKRKRVIPFKKGPDFIDPAWLERAAGHPCRNLDIYLMGEERVRQVYLSHCFSGHINIIEGNRGLFDGVNEYGRYSTAQMAKVLGVPVFLIINCTKMTGTAAALVMGCQTLDKKVPIAGVILNRVGGARHQDVITRSIEKRCGIPVVGAIPRLKDMAMFERHLGLMPVHEHTQATDVISQAVTVAEKYLNLRKILKLAHTYTDYSPVKSCRSFVERTNIQKKLKAPVFPQLKKRVGVLWDQAFNFYYPDNIEALEENGAEIIKISPVVNKDLPELDVLYIGGGFPETMAEALEANISFRSSLKAAAESGLRIYAECGGAVYLGEQLEYKGRVYRMAGVFPVDFLYTPKPQGHGYTRIKITKKNLFFKRGAWLQGHEFHYTGPLKTSKLNFVGKVCRGYGFDGKNECMVYKNVFATYTHIHAQSRRTWARGLLKGI
ncbi:MAG: cobyrinate a,c-diamide synthase [Fibrobacteria bacterium]|nr:cobyrinate a,c-diamide synthase [Fibrobacteria bacterium]